MLASLRQRVRFVALAAAAGVVAGAVAGGAARAADPQSDGREIVRSMADAVLATLRAGPDKAAREAAFRAMYRRNFDNAGIAAWAAGRAFAAASPAERQEYLKVFEDYIVKAYAAQLAKYKGERLRVDKTEVEGQAVIVISNLVPPDPRDPREIEMKWRLHRVGGRLVVSDVVIDKISMALVEKRAFADWLRERGGTLADLTAKLREKAAAIEKKD